MKKILLFIGGFVVLVFGILLVLRHWTAVAVVFQGVGPVLIAIAGLVMMFAASLKK